MLLLEQIRKHDQPGVAGSSPNEAPGITTGTDMLTASAVANVAGSGTFSSSNEKSKRSDC